jgi:NitT/TauT family transport system ATP-binding protein
MELTALNGRKSGTNGSTPNFAPVAAPTEALAFRHVSKVFQDGTQALDDVSLSIRPGEMVSIVGPSGCGKSTLLRLASRLSEATSGEIDIADGALGYVFQDATLLPWRTVQRNVELLAELEGVAKAERATRAREAIQLTGLAGFEGHLPRALSGGMRMRVSLARSLVMQPKVFLFDEPFGALDEITRERLNAELLDLFVNERFAGVFVTHSVSEATFLATRVVVMSARPGRIVAEIPVDIPYPRAPELRYQPVFTELAAEISARLRETLP